MINLQDWSVCPHPQCNSCISDCCCPWLLKDMGWRLILQSVSEQLFLLRGRVGEVQVVTFHDPKLLQGLTVPPQNAQPRTSLTEPLSDPVSQLGPGKYFQGTILHASGSLYLVLARQVHSPSCTGPCPTQVLPLFPPFLILRDKHGNLAWRLSLLGRLPACHFAIPDTDAAVRTSRADVRFGS